MSENMTDTNHVVQFLSKQFISKSNVALFLKVCVCALCVVGGGVHSQILNKHILTYLNMGLGEGGGVPILPITFITLLIT